jgi:hypothetical protein
MKETVIFRKKKEQHDAYEADTVKLTIPTASPLLFGKRFRETLGLFYLASRGPVG